jgi:hypothetical protein
VSAFVSLWRVGRRIRVVRIIVLMLLLLPPYFFHVGPHLMVNGDIFPTGRHHSKYVA